MTESEPNDLSRELEDLGGDITTAIQDLPIAAVVLDPEGVIRWQNGASETARGDLVGTLFSEFVAPGDLSQAQDVFRRILCNGEPAEFTLHVRDPEGGSARCRSAPLRSAGTEAWSVYSGWGVARARRTRPSLEVQRSGTVSASHLANSRCCSSSGRACRLATSPRRCTSVQRLSEITWRRSSRRLERTRDCRRFSLPSGTACWNGEKDDPNGSSVQGAPSSIIRRVGAQPRPRSTRLSPPDKWSPPQRRALIRNPAPAGPQGTGRSAS